MNNNNNTIGIIVVGIIAFIAIVVTGKWLLDRKHEHHEHRTTSGDGQPHPLQHHNNLA